jgi:colicin import membrane protein
MPRAPLALFCAALCLAAAVDARADDLEAEVKDMTWIGYQQLQDAARVFVKTTEPVKYTVDTSHAGLIVLILDNTRVPLFNNTRLLDTQYFDGPIVSVEAKAIEGPSQSVRVEIRTRAKVAPKPFQKDTLLALDFTKK